MIAIVGGGPAGSACASRLDDVIVFEEHRQIGRPVHCAGLLSPDAIKKSGVSPDILSATYGAEVVFPNGKSITVRSGEVKALSIDRAQFDSLLADRALAAGAEYRLGERVVSYRVSDDKVKIETSESSYEADTIIGADGHSSVVSRIIGNPSPRCLRGAQAEVSVRMDSDLFRVRLGSRYAPGFFSWEIPCGDFTRVGLCVNDGNPSEYLRRLLSDMGWEDRVMTRQGGLVPIGKPPRISAERTMLIGDAAWQVKPVSAGGIWPSMIAAPLAAAVVSSATEEGDFSARRLSRYDRECNRAFGKEIRRGLRLRTMFERMDDGDLNRAGEYACRKEVSEILNGISIDTPSSIVLQLLHNPKTCFSGIATLLRCLL